MSAFTVLSPNHTSGLTITASVGFISPVNNPNAYIVIENKRGWDIPGGHVEPDETPSQAFEREVQEEACCTLLPDVSLVAVLKSNQDPTTGINVYSGTCKVGAFKQKFETKAMRFVTRSELVDIYFGDKELIQAMLTMAEKSRYK